jgi:hypothetical protein
MWSIILVAFSFVTFRIVSLTNKFDYKFNYSELFTVENDLLFIPQCIYRVEIGRFPGTCPDRIVGIRRAQATSDNST